MARRGLAGEARIGRGKPRVDAGQRAAIGLIGTARRVVAALFGQRGDSLVDRGMLAGDRQLGAEPVDRGEIMSQHRLARAGQRGFERLGGDERIAVTVPADPRARTQEAWQAITERAIPALIERGQRRQKHVAQVGERGFHLIGDVQLFAAKDARLPQQGDLADDRLIHRIALRRGGETAILHRHQFGDAIAVIDHRLAAHFGGMRGEHRGDQPVREQIDDRRAIDPLRFKPSDGGGDIGALFGRHALPILGQIGEHRKQHEAAREIERLVKRQPIEAGIDGVRPGAPARAIDRGRSDIFDPPEQCIAAIGADDIAQQRAEKTDVGIVGDRGKLSHARPAALRQDDRQPLSEASTLS